MAAEPQTTTSAVSNGKGDAPLLEVKNLQTQFFTQDGVVRAVDNVSFYIKPGETLGVVGESGSGKSITGLSLMRLIPSPPGKIVNGEVIFQGKDVLKMSDEQVRNIRGNEIAMIFQDPMTSLNPVLTINRQISESLILHMGMNKEQAKARAIELLKMVGIPNAEARVDQYPHQFSGGMRQRVMIAMALSCNPKLLIADEPTTALDVTIQAQILDLMRNLQKETGAGVMMITHSMGVVAGMADRVQVMYAGHIVETATTEEIFANPRHPYTIGLMKSIPRLDARSKEKLQPIRGLPPDLIDLPDMCPFVPRCNYARAECEAKNPPLMEVSPGHLSACWFYKEVSKDDDQDEIAAKYGHPIPSDAAAEADPDAPDLGVSSAQMSNPH
ncbi:MAG: ABC transporter ATP-binding protein [Thermomicrobiales bacterium]|nr:ABC transporter ATP-binding protein [Thermomicrobiales bacterium]MCO5219106.1 ABC transporter ATP-binding protein [Thermomicrobiales bacterium]MCO5225412.1 ABC transporter ATP-binding protein [Thermomicrobiales bacterium]